MGDGMHGAMSFPELLFLFRSRSRQSYRTMSIQRSIRLRSCRGAIGAPVHRVVDICLLGRELQ